MSSTTPGAGATKKRVFVVDERRAIAEGLCHAISAEPDLECLGVFPTIRDAMKNLEQPPDVVVVTVQTAYMSELEGALLIKEQHPYAQVLIVTPRVDKELLQRGVTSFAAGIVLDNQPVGVMLDRIRGIAEGGIHIDRAALSTLLEHMSGPAVLPRTGGRLPRLTPRETEVLELMGDGTSVTGIAQRLGIEVNTCRGYVKAILEKLDVHSQLEAVVTALRLGILPGNA